MLGRYLKNPLAASFIILLAGVVLLCAGVLTYVILDVVRQDIATREAEDPRMCLAIKDDAERLACLETRVGRTPPSPARGANAPMNVFH